MIFFTLEQLYRKSLSCRYCFVMYHLDKHSISTAIQYKKYAQIFILSLNKIPMQSGFINTTESYTVCEHDLNTKYDTTALEKMF